MITVIDKGQFKPTKHLSGFLPLLSPKNDFNIRFLRFNNSLPKVRYFFHLTAESLSIGSRQQKMAVLVDIENGGSNKSVVISIGTLFTPLQQSFQVLTVELVAIALTQL